MEQLPDTLFGSLKQLKQFRMVAEAMLKRSTIIAASVHFLSEGKMTKVIHITTNTISYVVGESDIDVYVDTGSSIGTIDAHTHHENRNFYVNGDVTSLIKLGENSAGSLVNNNIHISATGHLSGGVPASVYVRGYGATIDNDGLIDNASNGIILTAANTIDVSSITNSGSTKNIGNYGINYQTYGQGELTNTGTIESSKIGVSVSGDVEFINVGRVSGYDAAIKMFVGLTNEGVHFINRGTVNGDIYTSAVNDVVDLRKGVLNGVVYGNTGEDTYLVSSQNTKIIAWADAGEAAVDTVKSTVSWALGKDFENLTLLGSGQTNGQGNTIDNILTGNSGSNNLFGYAGADDLDGGMGNDRLKGGIGNDSFIFKTNCGADSISDFTDGQDKVDLSGYRDYDAFADLKGHFKDVGDNVVLTLYGSDKITFVDVNLPELTWADFIF